MLDKIGRDILDEMNNEVSFDEYFQSYVMRLQDDDINSQISYMLSHNVVSINLIDRAIVSAIKELVV